MSTKKVLQDISINPEKYPIKVKFEQFYPRIELFEFIYKQSIVSQHDYYQACSFASFKTSNNQNILETLPYYVFNNNMIFLNEFIESENSSNGGKDSDADSMQNTAKNTMKETMGSTKNMMSGIKLPTK